MNKEKIKLSVAKLSHITGDFKIHQKYILIVQNSETGESVTKIFEDKKSANDIFYLIANVLSL